MDDCRYVLKYYNVLKKHDVHPNFQKEGNNYFKVGEVSISCNSDYISYVAIGRKYSLLQYLEWIYN